MKIKKIKSYLDKKESLEKTKAVIKLMEMAKEKGKQGMREECIKKIEDLDKFDWDFEGMDSNNMDGEFIKIKELIQKLNEGERKVK